MCAARALYMRCPCATRALPVRYPCAVCALQVCHDLYDTHIDICTVELLGLLQDNFDWQDRCTSGGIYLL